MKKNKTFKSKLLLVCLVLLLITHFSFAQQYQENTIPKDGNIYLNPELGNDHNSGTKGNPLKSLFEAARRLNQANGKGVITIFLSEGLYGLGATVTFHPANWHFTREGRLTIRAEILPDDAGWDPGKMPVIISTMPLNFKPYGNEDGLGGTSYGIQIETSHVTIQGLRVLGSPLHERPKDGMVKRNYPIVREGLNLDDLRVTQCLFIGDIHATPNHLAILASGQGVVVDHCVFYGVKDAVVFWFSDTPSENSEMHHNLIVNIYGAAVWSWSVDKDFRYYNNVVADAEIFWVLDKEKNSNKTFNLSNSMVIGYNHFVNEGGGASGFGTPANPKLLKYGKDVIIKKEGKVEIVKDPTSKYYLHLKPGTLGSELGAGLFMN
ncbi:MAG: hypothetical protein CO119_10990 [Flavobacteriales bacterium CG_4_9_14_3_um_filter_40_17]|nr:MAG: hypothetical protein CO119_10990 [Flavobacteriales bacterium CG_4_9_14_3_um_filter_40_17]